MEQVYQDYKDIAEIFIVYIREAHALDSKRPVPYAEELGIKQHVTFADRCEVAQRFVKDKKLTIPCLVDDISNKAGEAYQAWPDRVFLIQKDGRLAVAGKRGPWGFAPALKDANEWLAKYKATGREPDLKLADQPDHPAQPTAKPDQPRDDVEIIQSEPWPG